MLMLTIFSQTIQFWTIFHFQKWKIWVSFFTTFSPAREKIDFSGGIFTYAPVSTGCDNCSWSYNDLSWDEKKISGIFSVAHLAVGVSLVVVMTPMHGENLQKKQTNTKFFYCNLERKNLSINWCHHRTNSRQSSSEVSCMHIQSWYFIKLGLRECLPLDGLKSNIFIFAREI